MDKKKEISIKEAIVAEYLTGTISYRATAGSAITLGSGTVIGAVGECL